MKIFIAWTNFYRDEIAVSAHKTKKGAEKHIKKHAPDRPDHMKAIQTKEQKAADKAGNYHVVEQRIVECDVMA